MKTLFLSQTMKLLITVMFFVPVFVLADSNSVSSLVFTTDIRTVLPGTISEIITVQAQNSLNTAEDVSETNDVEFVSTSATGEFLNSSGNPVSKTMNKSTASRSFYYRDSAVGAHTLTVTIKGRETGKTFSTSQAITVGNAVPVPTNTNPTNTTTVITTKTNWSSHRSEMEVVGGEPGGFEIDIGRKNRLIIIGAPIELNAKVIKPKGVNLSEIAFTWSFGDGTSAVGSSVKHTYQFQGDYTVIANAAYYGQEAVARIVVKAVPQSTTITKRDGYLDMKNTGTYEVNLGGWIIETEKSKFVFPQDTIIPPNGSIKVSDDVTKLGDSTQFVLKSPLSNLSTRKTVSSNVAKGRVAGDFEMTINGVDKAKLEKSLKEALSKTVKKEVVKKQVKTALPSGTDALIASSTNGFFSTSSDKVVDISPTVVEKVYVKRSSNDFWQKLKLLFK